MSEKKVEGERGGRRRRWRRKKKKRETEHGREIGRERKRKGNEEE